MISSIVVRHQLDELGKAFWLRLFGTEDATRDVPLSYLHGFSVNPPLTVDGPSITASLYNVAARSLFIERYADVDYLRFWTDVLTLVDLKSPTFTELDVVVKGYFPGVPFYSTLCVGAMPVLYQVLGFISMLDGVETVKLDEEAICLRVIKGDMTVSFGTQNGILWVESKPPYRSPIQPTYQRRGTALWQGQSAKEWVAYPMVENRTPLGARGASLLRHLVRIRPKDAHLIEPVVSMAALTGNFNLMFPSVRWTQSQDAVDYDPERLARSLMLGVDSHVLTRRQRLYIATVPQLMPHQQFVSLFGEPLELFKSVVDSEMIRENLDHFHYAITHASR